MMGDILLLGAGRGGYSEGGGGGGGGGASGEVTYTVSASADDGSFGTPNNQTTSFPATFSILSSNTTFTASQREQDDDGFAFEYQKAFYRFQNINVAQGQTIQSAFLKIVMHSGTSSSAFFRIVGTDLDNVSAPSAASPDGDTSRHTSAIVSWSGAGLASFTYQTSPDIKTIIQEIVDRPGWSAGNAIMIQTYFDTQGSFGFAKKLRQVRSFDFSSAAYAAKLVITT